MSAGRGRVDDTEPDAWPPPPDPGDALPSAHGSNAGKSPFRFVVVAFVVVALLLGSLTLIAGCVPDRGRDVRALESAFPVIEDLRVTHFAIQETDEYSGVCTGFEYRRGKHVQDCSRRATQKHPFDDQAWADIGRLQAAVGGLEPLEYMWAEYRADGTLKSGSFSFDCGTYHYEPGYGSLEADSVALEPIDDDWYVETGLYSWC